MDDDYKPTIYFFNKTFAQNQLSFVGFEKSIFQWTWSIYEQIIEQFISVFVSIIECS